MAETAKRIRVDAKTFQEPLSQLVQTMVEKVFREGAAKGGWLPHVSEDVSMLLRYSLSIYHLLYYLNADSRRQNDCGWRVEYGVTAMSLVRSLIDCFYNVTAILQSPATKGLQYRCSGLRNALTDLDDLLEKYKGKPEWDSYINERKNYLDILIRPTEMTRAEIMMQPKWPTLGKYVSDKGPGGTRTTHQEFLDTFTRLEWRQYSALSHGAYEAFMGVLGDKPPIGAYYVSDFLPHEERPKVNAGYDEFLSRHAGMATALLLCLVTELQAYCKFDGANINGRICEIWMALLPLLPAKELHDGRYAKLMADKGISR